jgi:TetR/AcrR family transcriptional repressor of nem operon
MARPRNFDETEVIRAAGETFGRLGYFGTSIDDLLEATGLLRGSLYKAFGSKRNLFVKVLDDALTDNWIKQAHALDLFIIALKEMAAEDQEIADLCRERMTQSKEKTAKILGERLMQLLDSSD